jgi:hypothetical protein
VKTETIRLKPPADLMRPCKVSDPRPDAPTVRDIIASRELYREALAECDARMNSLRQWSSPPQG